MIDLIIEDGSLVDNANSYVTVEQAKNYVQNRGIEVFDDDETTTQNLLRAMDYLYSLNFKGVQTNSDQFLQWPRQQVYISGDYYLDDAVIPANIKIAQIEIAIAIAQGVIIFPNTGKVIEGSTGLIKRKKVDVLEKEFFAPTLPIMEKLNFPYVKELLRPFLINTFRLTVQRI